jgi:hypothetical protein
MHTAHGSKRSSNGQRQPGSVHRGGWGTEAFEQAGGRNPQLTVVALVSDKAGYTRLPA